MIKLLILTVMPSPYQRQLFAAMAADSGLDVSVRYFTVGAYDRQWPAPVFASYESVMAGHTIVTLGPSAHWNPSVTSEIAAAAADLVVVSDYSAPTAQFAMRFLARSSTPFVFWGEIPGFSKRGALGRFVRRRLQAPLGSAAAIVGIGSGAVEAYGKLFPGKPVYNIPYYCDLAPYRAARKGAPKRLGQTVDVLFSGQLIERKGVDVLIAAFVAIARDDPRLRLKLLGDGPDREALAAAVPSDLKGRVEFLGYRDPSELPTTFAEADVFCLPSRHDGWGVVVNEALGAGLPILVSNEVGAGRDLVANGENGFVTPAGNVAALAAALRDVAVDEVRARMSDASSTIGQNFDLVDGVARWRAATSEILAGCGVT